MRGPMTAESLLISFVALYAIIAARYFAIAGLFYWLLWGRDPEKVQARRLTDERPAPRIIWHEIKWYAFIAKEPRKYVGHNPLATLVMHFLFLWMLVFMIVTGLALCTPIPDKVTCSRNVF